jgi:hypothetical protein
MEHLLGFNGLATVAMITLYLVRRHPGLRMVLLVAFIARAGAALFHFYVAPLPDGTADARSFEARAWEMSQGGLSGALATYTGPNSYFISWIISLFYALTGRSPLMAQSLSILAGVGGVFVSWRLAHDLWGDYAAKKAAWIVALFPNLVQYSALTMREAFVIFFMLLGLLWVVRWVQRGGVGPILIGSASFVAATFFHGAMAVAAIAFLGLVGWRESYRVIGALSRYRLAVIGMITVIIIVLSVGIVVYVGVSLPKLGTLGTQEMLLERVAENLESSGRDTAAYPAWTSPKSPKDNIWAVPVRTAYLLFAPFPWDIRKPSHLIGLFDGLLYFIMVIWVWRNRKAVWADTRARALFLVLLPLIITFAVGSTNFGTGLRHRAKFATVIIVLAAPMIPRFVVSMKTTKTSLVQQAPSMGKC